MLIACAGDAHGAREYTDALVAALPGVEAFCYLGDGEEDALRLQYALAERQPNAAFYAVRGNCDVFFPASGDAGGALWADKGARHAWPSVSGEADLQPAGRGRAAARMPPGAVRSHAPAGLRNGGRRLLVNPGALAQGKWALVRVGEDGDIHAALRAL